MRTRLFGGHENYYFKLCDVLEHEKNNLQKNYNHFFGGDAT